MSRAIWGGLRLLPNWAIIGVTVALAVLIVNPQREFLTQDDGWAYARSVETLASSGFYNLDAWSAANMPVQIYLAAGAAKVFGYSLSLLRWTTLFLLTVYLFSFWHLARFCSASSLLATAMTVGVFASPVVFTLSFTFMSDIQFLGWLIAALVLYIRGLERQQLWIIFAGSIAASLAIGTRQFGIALLGGWVCAQAFSGKEARPAPSQFFVATLCPLLATIWQLWIGSGAPNITQSYRLAEQSVFLSQPTSLLIKELAWRTAIWIQYLSGFLLPVWPIIVGACLQRSRLRSAVTNLKISLFVLTIMLLVALGLHLDSQLTVRPASSVKSLWPPLGIFWVLQTMWHSSIAHRLLDTVAFLNIAPIAWFVISGARRSPDLLPVKAGVALLLGTGLALLGIIGVYVQFNDTYVVAVLPFAMLALAASLRRNEPTRGWVSASLVLSVVTILALSNSTRRNYDYQQQAWNIADLQVRAGMTYASVRGPRHWAEYHGAFDDWVRLGAPGITPAPRKHVAGQDHFHDPFYSWLAERPKRRAP